MKNFDLYINKKSDWRLRIHGADTWNHIQVSHLNIVTYVKKNDVKPVENFREDD